MRPLEGSSTTSKSNNPLTRKLSNFSPLTDSDESLLDALISRDEWFQRDTDIVAEGMTPRSVFVLKEGMAARYRSLPNGGRQIMTFLIPGDFCDVHAFLLRAMDHSIGTITPVRIGAVSRERMVELFATRPRISAALWWSSQQEEAMLRERIVALGRRDARGRIAYLLCELLWRYTSIGLAESGKFRLPLTQAELGDTLGLTAVHVNRVLTEFRKSSLITIEQGTIALLEIAKLQTIAESNQDYLQLGGMTPELAGYFDTLERKMNLQ